MNLLRKYFLMVWGLLIAVENSYAQKIVYSEPDRDDLNNNNYTIIGKLNGQYLIYKSQRSGSHYVAVFDNQMKLVEKNSLDFLDEKIISTDFLVYANYCYMFYQYQKRNKIFCMVVKLDSQGKKLTEPKQLDESEIPNFNTPKIYTLIFSEDKQKIMLFKLNNKDEKKHELTTLLFDYNIQLIHRSDLFIAMPERNDALVDFILDNNGTLFFIKTAGTYANENINKMVLLRKESNTDVVTNYELKIQQIFLDAPIVKMDNLNNRLVIMSFFSKQKRANIEGLYTCYFDDAKATVSITMIGFADELREEARGNNSLKAAFNDYYLRNLILKKDGGFIMAAEASYSTSRTGINSNRWDYFGGNTFNLGSGYYSPNIWTTDYYRNGFGYPIGRNSFNDVTRYYADNIVIISYDSLGKVEWTNVVNKSQFDENTDNLLGYTLVNTGDLLHFLFNKLERRNNILTEQTITAEGQINRNPTFKNLDKGYEFMPKYAKQVGLKQIIIPCQYRNYVCFAKIDIN